MKLRNKNTGEIGVINLKVYGDDAEYVYDKLETLYEDWEDNVPKEPLIKYDKLRKLISDWADLSHTENVLIAKRQTLQGKVFTEFFSQDTRISISVLGEFYSLEDMKVYTIEELCGEGQ